LNRLIVIVGPTASGKSAIAIQLARRFGCEIVSGDSMCVYQGMDIGTAKPSRVDRQQIPHHLIDVREPGEDFSVVDFQQMAGEAVEAICQKGEIPLLVGGTGLYVQALLEGYQFNSTPKTDLRSVLSAQDDESEEALSLHQKLTLMDPKTAARLHPNDQKRILRALEVISVEQQPISRKKRTDQPELLFDCIVFGLSIERQELYRRIDARVDRMLQEGLVAEVRALLGNGMTEKSTALQAIGYKEIAAHLRGAGSLEAAIAQIKQSSRRYAKRQLTWFRRMPYIRWIEQPTGAENGEDAYVAIERQVAEKFSIK